MHRYDSKRPHSKKIFRSNRTVVFTKHTTNNKARENKCGGSARKRHEEIEPAFAAAG